ncbi:17855_t:CDS:1, partial [Dentiscutata erythropus]
EMEYYTKCQCKHSIDQFIWKEIRHKTCIKSKRKQEQADNMLSNIITHSLDNYELNSQDSFEIFSEESFAQDM